MRPKDYPYRIDNRKGVALQHSLDVFQPGIYDPICDQSEECGSGILTVIADNATWLQESPRSSFDIVLRFFPKTIRRMKDAVEMIEWIVGYLFEAGYTPCRSMPHNPIWLWLEGKLHPQP